MFRDSSLCSACQELIDQIHSFMRDNFAQYFDKPKFKQLLARYEEMLTSDHTSYFEATELTDIAEYYAMQGDTEQAEAALDYALRLHPDNIDALIFKSRSRLINGHITEASHILDSITDQNDREVMFLRAEVLMATHQHTKAHPKACRSPSSQLPVHLFLNYLS